MNLLGAVCRARGHKIIYVHVQKGTSTLFSEKEMYLLHYRLFFSCFIFTVRPTPPPPPPPQNGVSKDLMIERAQD
jgi:hypothetical protein